MSPQTAGEPGPAGDLPEDVLVDLVDDECRRRILKTLLDAESPMVIDDLAAAVVARRDGVEPSDVDSADADSVDVDPAERRRVRDEIFQEHLPKLSATEVVAYDSMLATLELRAPAAIEDALDGALETA